MRTIIPFLMMIVVDLILIRHIRESKKRVNQNRNKKKELKFTIAVVFLNSVFIFFNFPMAVGLLYQNIPAYANPQWNQISVLKFIFYIETASLWAYMFQISEFWLNFWFNKLFRKEIIDFVNKKLLRNRFSLGNRLLEMGSSIAGKSQTENFRLSTIQKSSVHKKLEKY